MGALADKVRADMTAAMKAQEKERLSTLRMLQSSLKNEQINLGHELSDEEAMTVIRKAMKQREDSIEQYTNAGRDELAAKEAAEITVIETYLPQAATPEEIERAVAEAITETGASSMKEMGAVMKATMVKLQGKSADGKMVSEAVKAKLG